MRAPASRISPTSFYAALVQDEDHQVVHVLAPGPGDLAQVLARGGLDVHTRSWPRPGPPASACRSSGRVRHGPAGSHAHHRNGVGTAEGRRFVPSTGSTASSTARSARRAHPLAVVQPRGLVLHALADDHPAVDAQGLEGQAHGVHRRPGRRPPCRPCRASGPKPGPRRRHAHQVREPNSSAGLPCSAPRCLRSPGGRTFWKRGFPRPLPRKTSPSTAGQVLGGEAVTFGQLACRGRGPEMVQSPGPGRRSPRTCAKPSVRPASTAARFTTWGGSTEHL